MAPRPRSDPRPRKRWQRSRTRSRFIAPKWDRIGFRAEPSVEGDERTVDQSKKTMRHFYCRDVLWETFEQMANDFDCSIDYLVNEAMRYYARSKNYQSPGGPPTQGAAAVSPNNTG